MPDLAPRRVGIVGLSAGWGFASTAHLPALRRLPSYEVLGLAASSPERAAIAAKQHGIPIAFPDAHALVRSNEIDVVAICVKVPHHYALAKAAIEAGKAVLCEWPLGRGVEEADDLATSAQVHRVQTAVGLQARSSPTIRYLRDLVTEGYVGEVLSTSLIGSGVTWGGSLRRSGARYTLDASNGATMLSIPMGHALDTIAYVVGDFTRVSATVGLRRPAIFDPDSDSYLPMTTPDQVAATGELAGGAIFSVHYRGGQSRATNFWWEINGSDGDIVVTGGNGHLQLADLELRGARSGDTELKTLSVPDRYHLVRDLIGSSARVVNVANAYAQWAQGTMHEASSVPDFAHAAAHHRLLRDIEEAAKR